MSTTLSLPEQVVEYIGHTDAALEQAETFQKEAAVKSAAARALIPACVDQLVANGRIKADQREKAAAALLDHAECLRILTKVAGHRNGDEQAKLGQGVEKSAAATNAPPALNSENSPFVGGRSPRIKQSDHALFSGLGLAPPTEA